MIQAVENDAATYYPERGLHNDGCAGRFYITKVSTVNRTYARLSLNNRKRSARGCLVGDGYKVLRRQGGIWTPLMDGSWDVAMCTRLGRAVALDLTRDARLTCD